MLIFLRTDIKWKDKDPADTKHPEQYPNGGKSGTVAKIARKSLISHIKANPV